jgi:hypothetical protein
MQSLVTVGERAAAIQHARTHETLLVDELEVQPDAAVRDFAEQLRRDDAVEQEAAIAAPVPGVISTAAGSGSDVEAAQPVSLVSEDGSQSLPARPAVQRVSRRARWSLLAAALVIATLVTAIAVAGRERRALASRPAPATRTIAVLPFANLSANAENEYFSDGITDELIVTLGQVRGLRVVSRTSAFAFKNGGVDVRDVARRLGAVAVIACCGVRARGDLNRSVGSGPGAADGRAPLRGRHAHDRRAPLREPQRRSGSGGELVQRAVPRWLLSSRCAGVRALDGGGARSSRT